MMSTRPSSLLGFIARFAIVAGTFLTIGNVLILVDRIK